MFDPARLVQGNDEETASASYFDHDGQELWVDCAEVRVQSVPGDPDVVVTLVPLHRSSVHVSELGAEIMSTEVV